MNHHTYTLKMIQRILRLAIKCNASALTGKSFNQEALDALWGIVQTHATSNCDLHTANVKKAIEEYNTQVKLSEAKIGAAEWATLVKDTVQNGDFFDGKDEKIGMAWLILITDLKQYHLKVQPMETAWVDFMKRLLQQGHIKHALLLHNAVFTIKYLSDQDGKEGKWLPMYCSLLADALVDSLEISRHVDDNLMMTLSEQLLKSNLFKEIFVLSRFPQQYQNYDGEDPKFHFASMMVNEIATLIENEEEEELDSSLSSESGELSSAESTPRIPTSPQIRMTPKLRTSPRTESATARSPKLPRLALSPRPVSKIKVPDDLKALVLELSSPIIPEDESEEEERELNKLAQKLKESSLSTESSASQDALISESDDFKARLLIAQRLKESSFSSESSASNSGATPRSQDATISTLTPLHRSDSNPAYTEDTSDSNGLRKSAM